ncbi:unnamed protein product [Schistosoma curassoni]|uniref:Reverse transcriptase domain-containing protein n=1 Tax=Schistosoma curassoni TaxID=6186 RepID=A0A183JI49_9TREM|nr:unnamed protein product [Schistosoma curassoni]
MESIRPKEKRRTEEHIALRNGDRHEKNEQNLAVCISFNKPNEALEAHQYPLPVQEDLFAKPNRGKEFAKLDLSEAYLYIPVAEECRQ